MFKQTVKNIIGNSFSTFQYPIVVNSYGRSGSTVLTKSIVKGGVKPQINPFRKIASGSIRKSAWDLETTQLEDGFVYKTHDYPPANIHHEHMRMLYTFADPINVVLSLLQIYKENGESWMRHHYEHLGASYTNFENIINKDQLHLEDHFTSWLNERRIPIAFIRYETMWDNKEDLSNFLGFNVKLPPYRKRKAVRSENRDLVLRLEKTYNSLKQKTKNLDNFFIING